MSIFFPEGYSDAEHVKPDLSYFQLILSLNKVPSLIHHLLYNSYTRIN